MLNMARLLIARIDQCLFASTVISLLDIASATRLFSPFAGIICKTVLQLREGIFKLLRSPRIDSKESIAPAYVAWRTGTITFPYAVPDAIDCSKIPALGSSGFSSFVSIMCS